MSVCGCAAAGDVQEGPLDAARLTREGECKQRQLRARSNPSLLAAAGLSLQPATQLAMSDRRHGATSMERQLSETSRSDLEAAAQPDDQAERSAQSPDDSRALVISFVLMVVIGLGNKIFQKLQTIPMHNYANSLNLMTTFFYIPASFAYILPMVKWGKQITPQQRAVPMSVFAVMGLLDSLAGIMQVFAATYLDGTLLILLQQSAIPISMGISKAMLSEKYQPLQYLGALIVTGGIAVVLVPRLGHHGGNDDSSGSGETLSFSGTDGSGWLNSTAPPAACSVDDGGSQAAGKVLLWSVVMILSCVPMTLSSVYKQKALGETDLDPEIARRSLSSQRHCALMYRIYSATSNSNPLTSALRSQVHQMLRHRPVSASREWRHLPPLPASPSRQWASLP